MPVPVFVCGATGVQGSAVARHLRMADVPVHALVRDPSSARAKDLQSIGITLFPGSYDDDAALGGALKDTQAAFLNFVPNLADATQELRHAKAVLSAAKEAGVKHVVHSSSYGIDENAPPPPGQDPDGIVAKVYKAKKDIVHTVCSAGFDSYTILRPAKFLSDLYGPGAIWFGGLSKTGTFETALRKGERAPWVDADDIGAFGAAALLDPERFDGKRVGIFTEMLAIEDVVGLLGEATGTKLGVRFLDEVEVEERRKKGDILIEAQIGMRGMGEGASREEVEAWGVPLGSFRGFLEKERAQLLETYGHLA